MKAHSREDLLNQLKNPETPFDILIIGGGATGAGVAFDATLRGYKVALVEAEDFGSQTSSRSTKLLHGGIRYLEKAFKELDWRQFSLVKEALKERTILLKSIPRLTRSLPILIPVYSYFEAAYYGFGIKIYELLARHCSIGKSCFLGLSKTLSLFPSLKKKGLKGGILYYDGQFDDARFNLSMIFLAIQQGAVVVNHVKVNNLVTNQERIEGAFVKDQETGESWPIPAKVTINATGPFGDTVRQLASPSLQPLVKGSSGAHLILDHSYTSKGVGLLIPRTPDGRVAFLLPWKKKTLLGTTDVPKEVIFNPHPSHKETQDLISYAKKYFGEEINEESVSASWSGIRPLIGEKKGSTSEWSRDFIIEKGVPGFYSILGGKWTAFRKMAETLLDQIVQEGVLIRKRDCQTEHVPWIKEDEKELNDIKSKLAGWDVDIQEHLLMTYGLGCVDVIKWVEEKGMRNRLAEGYPYLEGEVVWAAKNEYARSLKDVLLRRIPLGMIDQKVAEIVSGKVVELVGDELGWSEEKKLQEIAEFCEYAGIGYN